MCCIGYLVGWCCCWDVMKMRWMCGILMLWIVFFVIGWVFVCMVLLSILDDENFIMVLCVLLVVVFEGCFMLL